MTILPETVIFGISGQIGKQFIYWTVRGRQFKRPYIVPFDPKTAAQIAHRDKFAAAAMKWSTMPEWKKEEWREKERKAQAAMTGYNYYMRAELRN